MAPSPALHHDRISLSPPTSLVNNNNNNINNMTTTTTTTESALRHLSTLPGVHGYIVLSASGVPIKFHGIEAHDATVYGATLSEVMEQTRRMVRNTYGQHEHDEHPEDEDINKDEQLVSIRLRTLKQEVIVVPDHEYTLIVLHENAHTEAKMAQAAATSANTNSSITNTMKSTNNIIPTTRQTEEENEENEDNDEEADEETSNNDNMTERNERLDSTGAGTGAGA